MYLLRAGQVPDTDHVPATGQVPVNAQVPTTGQVPATTVVPYQVDTLPQHLVLFYKYSRHV